MAKGMGSHQSARMKTDEWITPPHIIESLGVFDLDPCAPDTMPWDTAIKYYTAKDDGLMQPWFGRVWCNPPYGLVAAKWLRKMAHHNNGIALVFARTETKMFFNWVWPYASGILFIQGRLYFHDVHGKMAEANAGAPSVLISYGDECNEILKKCDIKGKYINLKA